MVWSQVGFRCETYSLASVRASRIPSKEMYQQHVEQGCSLEDLTVLAPTNDPFRPGTPARYRDGLRAPHRTEDIARHLGQVENASAAGDAQIAIAHSGFAERCPYRRGLRGMRRAEVIVTIMKHAVNPGEKY